MRSWNETMERYYVKLLDFLCGFIVFCPYVFHKIHDGKDNSFLVLDLGLNKFLHKK